MSWAVQLFIPLGLLWLALSGLANWLVGLTAVGAGTALGAWLVPVRAHAVLPHRFVGFLAWFLLEVVKGGADVAWRAVHPSLPIEPHSIDYTAELPTGQPTALFVSVVSLLPGTLSADLIDGGTVVVHSIVPEPRPALERLERKIATLFSLTGSGQSR